MLGDIGRNADVDGDGLSGLGLLRPSRWSIITAAVLMVLVLLVLAYALPVPACLVPQILFALLGAARHLFALRILALIIGLRIQVPLHKFSGENLGIDLAQRISLVVVLDAGLNQPAFLLLFLVSLQELVYYLLLILLAELHVRAKLAVLLLALLMKRFNVRFGQLLQRRVVFGQLHMLLLPDPDVYQVQRGFVPSWVRRGVATLPLHGGRQL